MWIAHIEIERRRPEEYSELLRDPILRIVFKFGSCFSKLQENAESNPINFAAHMINQLVQSIEISAIVSILAYLCTYFSLGDRADRLPGGAIVMSFFLTPWWAALLAGVAAHIAGILIVRVWKKRAIPKPLIMALFLVVACMLFSTEYVLNSAVSEIVTAVKESESEAWERVSKQSAAGAFVNAKYRPCVDAIETTYSGLGLRAFGTSNRRTDPVVCADSTVSLAKQNGDDFSREVAQTIENLPALLALSEKANAAVDRVLESTGTSSKNTEKRSSTTASSVAQ